MVWRNAGIDRRVLLRLCLCTRCSGVGVFELVFGFGGGRGEMGVLFFERALLNLWGHVLWVFFFFFFLVEILFCLYFFL